MAWLLLKKWDIYLCYFGIFFYSVPGMSLNVIDNQ